MKKILFAAILSFAFLFTACAAPTAQLAELTYEKEDIAFDEYDDNLEGLEEYLEDKNLIAGNATEMSYDFISAIAGQKYFYTTNSVSLSCEIYEYDSENLDDKAKEIINSIKENGHFVSLDTEITAVLSDNEKYVMILGGDTENEQVADYMTDLNESFKAFYA